LQPLSDSQRETLEETTALYEEARTADHGLYLLGRGLEPETIATFRLGSVVDPAPGHAHLRGRLAVPYLGRTGSPLWHKFRCVEDHDHRALSHGKYGAPMDGGPSRLFNVGALDQAKDTIHVAEGEFDAMILCQAGLPAVAVPGVQNWKGHFGRLLAGFNRVWIWADPDEAGAELVNTITKRLVQAKPVRLKDGDVTDTYLNGGEAALKELIKEKK
jgi:DNA primase